ncbi:MAG TPA: hypothetical protein VEK76_13390 [Candidatus Binatia bacterium]|nr:hypothetical protein [Candidatus Binatia bacterium]
MRRTAALGGALILLADGLYLWMISRQGATDGTLRVPVVAAYLGACGVAALVAAALPWPVARLALLSFSAAGTFILGVLGIFSVGLILLLMSLPVMAAVVRSPVPSPARRVIMLVAALVALGASVVGLWATEFPVSCPPTGASTGSGVGFLTGDYHWTCVDGQLTTGGGLVHPSNLDGGSGNQRAGVSPSPAGSRTGA